MRARISAPNRYKDALARGIRSEIQGRKRDVPSRYLRDIISQVTPFTLVFQFNNCCPDSTSNELRLLQHIRRRTTDISSRGNYLVGLEFNATRCWPYLCNVTAYLNKIASIERSKQFYLLITYQQPFITITENRQFGSNIA